MRIAAAAEEIIVVVDDIMPVFSPLYIDLTVIRAGLNGKVQADDRVFVSQLSAAPVGHDPHLACNRVEPVKIFGFHIGKRQNTQDGQQNHGQKYEMPLSPDHSVQVFLTGAFLIQGILEHGGIIQKDQTIYPYEHFHAAAGSDQQCPAEKLIFY